MADTVPKHCGLGEKQYSAQQFATQRRERDYVATFSRGDEK